MFWKKPKKTENVLYSYEDDPSNRREYIRVSPLPEAPVSLDLQGQTADLLDISAGGLAFSGVQAQLGQEHRVAFDLPGEHRSIAARIKVTAISGNGIVHGELLDLTDEMAETIHHYVLNVQKEKIRRSRQK